MKIDCESILKIGILSPAHISIIILSVLFSVAFITIKFLFLKFDKNNTKTNIFNKVVYTFSILIAILMCFNPSIWYQLVFITDDKSFYLNAFEIIIYILNIICCVSLPFSLISKNKGYKIFAFISLPLILIQIINPSMNTYYASISNNFFNDLSIFGYSSYLCFFIGISFYQIVDLTKTKIEFKDLKLVIISLALLFPILIPYIFFSRFDTLVARKPNGTIDLTNFYEGLSITRFSFSHLVYIFENAIIFIFYYYVISTYFKENNLYDVLLLLISGVIITVFCRRATYLFDKSPGFFLLPDSPCAVGSFVIYFGLLFKNKAFCIYSVLTTFAFTALNNILLFQGNISNFWYYLSMDSSFYHLYTCVIAFSMLNLDCIEINKKNVLDSGLIFLSIFLFFTLLGNIQTRIEFKLDIDMSAKYYVGFFYKTPAFAFLSDFVYFASYRENGFDIVPINWILTIFAGFILPFLSSLFLNLLNKTKLIEIKQIIA